MQLGFIKVGYYGRTALWVEVRTHPPFFIYVHVASVNLGSYRLFHLYRKRVIF